MRRLAVVLVLAALAAGCGSKNTSPRAGTSTPQTTAQPQQAKQSYAAALVEAAKATNREGEHAMSELKAQKPNAIADLKASVADFHDRLAKITPPRGIAGQHQALVAAAAQLTKQFAAAVDANKQKKYASIKPLTDLKRYPAGKRIVHITAQINAEGYKIG